jgi:hypothetical protein
MLTLKQLSVLAALASTWVAAGSRVPTPFDYATVAARAAALYDQYAADIDPQRAYIALVCVAVAWLYYWLTAKVSSLSF